MRGPLFICRECQGSGCEECKYAGGRRRAEEPLGFELPKMTLPDDAAESLRTIADYISTARSDRQRIIRRAGHVEGYWQSEDWTDGLRDLGEDALRVARLARGKEALLVELSKAAVRPSLPTAEERAKARFPVLLVTYAIVTLLAYLFIRFIP